MNFSLPSKSSLCRDRYERKKQLITWQQRKHFARNGNKSPIELAIIDKKIADLKKELKQIEFHLLLLD